MSDAPRKRSRFDQTEPEPPRRSRFDHRNRDRSRSPRRSSDPDNHRQRTRSPQASAKPVNKADIQAIVEERKRRIEAAIEAKKATQPSPPVDAPPRDPHSITPDRTKKLNVSVTSDIYTQDGDYIKDIEVNDLRNRYTLTKGATQKMIKEATGADVTTRGEYYPDKSMATPSAPPLYLHITSTSKEGLEAAVAKIQEMMQQDLPNLVDERRFRRGQREQEHVDRDEHGRRKWPEERIPIDMEPIPGFNLRAQVVGQGGQYVKYIQQETGCRVQIKGRGSGFIETATNNESDEPMFLHITGPQQEMVDKAKDQAMQLLATVKESYDQHKERGHSRGYGRDRESGYGRGRSHDNYGGGHGTPRGYGTHQSPPASGGSSMHGGQAAAAGANDGAADYAQQWAAYYAQYPQADPYAAYGGYDAYVQMYNQYYGQQATSQSPTPGTVGPPGEQPPPPPTGDHAAPPPPPASVTSYHSVPPPPPPGM